MSLLMQIGAVRAARAKVATHRAELAVPASALLARGHRHPLTTMGAAAGAGFVLGSLNVHPLRVPGLSSLLRGGLAEAVAYGAKLVAELGLADSGGDA